MGVNGGPCCTANETACAGHAQKLVLICDPNSHKWTALQTCSGAQLCDTSVGTNQGSCQEPVALCVGKQPGDKLCDGATAVQCGPDLVTSTSTACSGTSPVCLQGECVACTPASKQCIGQQPQTCDGNGAWQDGAACVDQACDAVNGGCKGECTPASKQCNGLTPRTCDDNGAWLDGTACQYACQSGGCVGVCTPGTKRCSGKTPQTCNANWQWDSAPECSAGLVCMGDGLCSMCPSTGGMPMVAMPQGYCIDATEVTYAQYHAWQSGNPSTNLMPPECTSWKSAYNAGTGSGSRPVATVDWCDAYAYCKALGRRLCGKIGGGPNGYADHESASLSQWFNACSSNGVNAYPYGSTSNDQACNGAAHGVGTSVVVASMPGCMTIVAGYVGVYDLSGNVSEWEDSCGGNSGQSDYCHVRGGGFTDSGYALTCNEGFGITRGYAAENLGFRCCLL